MFGTNFQAWVAVTFCYWKGGSFQNDFLFYKNFVQGLYLIQISKETFRIIVNFKNSLLAYESPDEKVQSLNALWYDKHGKQQVVFGTKYSRMHQLKFGRQP